MQTLARVFFQVKASNADRLLPAWNIDLDRSMFGEWFVVLRDLIALWKIGIEIILARKDRSPVDSALQSHRRQGRKFHGLPVQHGQSPRHSQTHRADVAVWWVTEMSGARAEDFRCSKQLDVNFETNDGLILREESFGDGWSCRHTVKL